MIPVPALEAQINPSAVFEKYELAVEAIAAASATSEDAKLLDLSIKIFENDANRRASIDSRAAAMMSAITLAAALVTGVGFTMFKDTSALPLAAFWSIFCTFALTLLYLTATTVLLFQIQGRVFRSTLDPTDLNPLPGPRQVSKFQRRVAVRVLRYTIANYKINNRVIARLWAAQKCFRNALLVLVLGGLVTTVILIPPRSGIEGGHRLAQALARAAGCTDLPPLILDRNGLWRGLCLIEGKSTKVLVNPDGRVDLSP